MAILDDSEYQEWVRAFDKLQAVRARCKAAESTWGPDHLIVRQVKKSLDEAQRQYDEVVERLT